MTNPNLPADEGDRPIIIQGGGSVNIIVPPNFTDQAGSGYQAGGGNGKDFKNGNVNLVSLQIDENTPIPLNRTSKITIIYK